MVESRANQMQPPADGWGLVTQTLHWLTAALVLVMIALGIYMADLPLGPDKLELYGLHKSVGMAVLILTVLRVFWRLAHPAPPPLSPAAPWERSLARAVHLSFYALLIAMPLAGWVMSSAANFSVSVFGLFVLPDFVAPDKALSDAAKAVHYWLGWLLIALLALHVAGALKHHFIWRDATLRRMIPFANYKEPGR